MPYIYGNRTQLTYLPASIDDYIKPDDPVHAYDAFIDALSPNDLGLNLDEDRVGPPEYDPISMLKLLVYGYSYGIRSSRQLERAVHHNLSFIWLMGGLRPDHKTIARFRRNHRATVVQVMKQSVRMCIKFDLVEGNVLFVDGTKIKANASINQTWGVERCDQKLQDIDRRIEELLNAIEAIDTAEEGQGSIVHLKAELADQQRLRQRMQEVADALKERKNKKGGTSAYNVVDPESRVMFNRQGTLQGFNGQIVCDGKHGFIVSTDVVNTPNDTQQLAPQVQQAEAQLGKPCQTVVADCGYYSTDGIATLDQQGTQVIIPTPHAINRWSSNPAFEKTVFRYDPQKNCYECPQGHYLRWIKHDHRGKCHVYKIEKASHCHTCPHWGMCTQSKVGRSIVRLENEALRESIKQKYQQPEAQEIYSRRKEMVEHPFGDLKQNFGLRMFALRGLEGVRALWATHFNLRRAIALLGGPIEFKKALQSI
jgi:transposase